jgi:hypothetical protein
LAFASFSVAGNTLRDKVFSRNYDLEQVVLEVLSSTSAANPRLPACHRQLLPFVAKGMRPTLVRTILGGEVSSHANQDCLGS